MFVSLVYYVFLEPKTVPGKYYYSLRECLLNERLIKCLSKIFLYDDDIAPIL